MFEVSGENAELQFDVKEGAEGASFTVSGKISDDEIKDFAFISNKLDEISLAIDSLNLWVDKTAGEQGLNIELLREEKKKQK